MRLLALLSLTMLLVGCSSETAIVSPLADTALDTGAAVEREPISAEPDTGSLEPETCVIDVRSQKEWDGGHVAEAVHIPHTEIAERISEVTDDRDAKIILYCAVGGRAGKAKTTLQELGYTDVENGGGLDDMQERFEVIQTPDE